MTSHSKRSSKFSLLNESGRSISEPSTRRNTASFLPSVALSDISRRNSRAGRRGMGVEPWHSSTTIRHGDAPSLSSMSSISTERRAIRLAKIEQPAFKVEGPDLNSLPKTIFKMENLEKLVLSPDKDSCIHSKLPSIPKEVGNLRHLRQLVLDTNELDEIPRQLADLEHLDTLTLSNNHLTTLPDGFSNLVKLESLHLANNRFTEIPIEICLLENLTFLDMSDNLIQEIPEEIYLLADKISTLILYINELQSLPDCICDLYELTTLWLGRNRLKSLPTRFGDLEKLDWGEYLSETNIDDNPLITPPVEVCRKGIVAIKKYFRRIVSHEDDPAAYANGNGN